MNVVVSNQAVLEKNSPLLLTFLTSLFFSSFFTCNQPVLLLRRRSPASLRRGGRGAQPEGTVGPGENPTSGYLHIRKSSSGFKVDAVRKPPCFGSKRPCALLRAPGKSEPVWGFFESIPEGACRGKAQPPAPEPNPASAACSAPWTSASRHVGTRGQRAWALPSPLSRHVPRIPRFTGTVPPAPSGDTATTWETRSCLSQTADE